MSKWLYYIRFLVDSFMQKPIADESVDSTGDRSGGEKRASFSSRELMFSLPYALDSRRPITATTMIRQKRRTQFVMILRQITNNTSKWWVQSAPFYPYWHHSNIDVTIFSSKPIHKTAFTGSEWDKSAEKGAIHWIQEVGRCVFSIVTVVFVSFCWDGCMVVVLLLAFVCAQHMTLSV